MLPICLEIAEMNFVGKQVQPWKCSETYLRFFLGDMNKSLENGLGNTLLRPHYNRKFAYESSKQAKFWINQEISYASRVLP